MTALCVPRPMFSPAELSHSGAITPDFFKIWTAPPG